MTGYQEITKEKFYRLGGFSNPRCVRVTRFDHYAYFYRID
jgi:hypothetical protein